MADPFRHCGHCGAAFTTDPWPRKCASCGALSYRNPLPVAVLIVPVGAGVLAIRRAIDPGRGKLALPGGFVNWGESWQQAAARELFEETQVVLDPRAIRALETVSSDDGHLLVFGAAPPLAPSALPPFSPTDETSERTILPAPIDLAFPLHTRALAAWFSRPP